MANNFVGAESTGITTETVVYTGKTATQATVIGLTIANTSGKSTTASVKKNSAYIIKNAPVPSGGSIVAVGGDQKLVIGPSDTVGVSADNTVDVVLSVLEIS